MRPQFLNSPTRCRPIESYGFAGLAKRMRTMFVIATVLLSSFTAPARPADAASTVCSLHCDARDPSLAVSVRQAAVTSVWSRVITLYVSDGDDMAWANVGTGSPGDEVWLDRSFDGGQTWAGGSKLGDTTIPAGSTGWRTMMYNIDDPHDSQVGVIRACGKAGDRTDIACTSWQRATHAVVCSTSCDARDPSSAVSVRQAAVASVWSRVVTLFVSDGDDMAWANVGTGSPGDEVWLDRSFDGGQTWADGSKLGDTTIPAGSTGWRTMMYNIDDPAKFGVGAIRACGKAADRTDIACTQWMRSTTHAATSQAAAVTALMQYFNPVTGSWSNSLGWQDAQALTALIDYIRRTGDSTYAYAIPILYGDNKSSNFTDGYMDDAGWWGMAWLLAYQYTGVTAYLQAAEYDANYMSQYWDNTCGGGVWWSTALTAKNAIANELYLELNAALHNALSGETTYLGRARQEWAWFAQSGLINSGNLINDGLNLSTCRNDGAPTYTYNQGVILAGLGQLYRATGDTSLVSTGDAIATAATTVLTANGILVDPCEPNGCAPDGYSFKGIFVRDLDDFAHVTGTTGYDSFLSNQAASILARDTDGDAQSGLYWAGPLNAVNYADQQSATDALVAAMG